MTKYPYQVQQVSFKVIVVEWWTMDYY